MIAELVREAALEGVRDELPHSLAVVVEEMVPREGRPDGQAAARRAGQRLRRAARARRPSSSDAAAPGCARSARTPAGASRRCSASRSTSTCTSRSPRTGSATPSSCSASASDGPVPSDQGARAGRFAAQRCLGEQPDPEPRRPGLHPVRDMATAVPWYAAVLGFEPGVASHEGTIYDIPTDGETRLAFDANRPEFDASGPPRFFFWTERPGGGGRPPAGPGVTIDLRRRGHRERPLRPFHRPRRESPHGLPARLTSSTVLDSREGGGHVGDCCTRPRAGGPRGQDQTVPPRPEEQIADVRETSRAVGAERAGRARTEVRRSGRPVPGRCRPVRARRVSGRRPPTRGPTVSRVRLGRASR